jgi:hypothetical protein
MVLQVLWLYPPHQQIVGSSTSTLFVYTHYGGVGGFSVSLVGTRADCWLSGLSISSTQPTRCSGTFHLVHIHLHFYLVVYTCRNL